MLDRIMPRPRLAAWIPAVLFVTLAIGQTSCGSSTERVDDAGIEVLPLTISFEQVILDFESFQTVTIRSTGDATLIISDLRIDANTDDLRLDEAFGARLELERGQEHVVTVAYAPTDPNTQAQGDLVIGTNVRGREEIRIPIVTPPLSPVLSAFPDPIDFGEVAEASTNPRPVEITNRGSAPAIIQDIYVTGSSDYTAPALENIELPYTLDVFVIDDESRQDVLTFDVLYNPQAPGADEGALVIEYNSIGGESKTIELTGEAGVPDLVCSPDPVSFGPSPLAMTSSITVNCTNNGNAALELEEVSLDPEGDPEFELSNVPSTLQERSGTISLPTGSAFSFIVDYTPPSETTNLTQIYIDYLQAGADKTKSIIVTGVGTDNRCPISSPTGYVRNDSRRSRQIDWATPTDILILDGSNSTDPDGEIVTYEWDVVRSPQGAPTELIPVTGQPNRDDLRQYFIPLQGRYEFQLRVYDDLGFQDCDEPAIVTVLSLPDEDVHIELTWTNPLDPDEFDDAGSDVDLHFVKMPANWFSEFDTYFANDEPFWNPELPSLDIDDTDGAGPENIQMDNPVECQWYAVGVHYFEKQFGTAYANIRIFVNDPDVTQVDELVNRPLVNTDDFWDVGRLHWPTGLFFRVDEIYENFDSSTATPPALTPDMVEAVANTGLCN